jgi:hypothetical protein
LVQKQKIATIRTPVHAATVPGGTNQAHALVVRDILPDDIRAWPRNRQQRVPFRVDRV